MNLPSEQPHPNLAARSNEQTEDLFNSGTLGARAGGAHGFGHEANVDIDIYSHGPVAV